MRSIRCDTWIAPICSHSILGRREALHDVHRSKIDKFERVISTVRQNLVLIRHEDDGRDWTRVNDVFSIHSVRPNVPNTNCSIKVTGDRLLLGGVVTDGVHVTRGQHGTCRVSSIEIPHFYVSILGTRDGAFTVYVADTSRRDLLSVSCKPVLHVTGGDVP